MRKFTLQDGRRRFAVISCLLLLLFVGVILRLGWIQIIRADDMRKMNQDQLNAYMTRKQPRGRIVDRDGEELAVSIMTGSLYVDPEEMNKDAVNPDKRGRRNVQRLAAELLAPVLKIDTAELYLSLIHI